MAANTLPPQTPPRPGGGGVVKIQHFQDMVMLHIKLNGIRDAATYMHIFCPFLKEVELHIKLKGMEHRAPCKHIPVFCPYTHPQPVASIKR